MTRRLYLVRHGSIGHLDGRYIGRSDPSLSAMGRGQARQLRKMLAGSKNAEVWSSPLARCRETASIAFPNRTARLHAELSEMNFGLWEGLTFDEARKRHPESARRWLAGDARFRFPSGESLSQFRRRLERVRKKIERSRAQVLIVVAHGGVIRGLLSLYLKTPFVTLFSFRIGYGAALRLTLHSTGAALESLSQNIPNKRGTS